MVTPEHDDGVITQSECVELAEHSADLSIGVADAGGVVLTHGGGVAGIGVGIFPVPIVFHELSGSVPGGFPFGFGGVRDLRELDVLVEIEILFGSTKGEVWAENSGGEEEGLFVSGEELELLQGFLDREAIGVNFIAAFEGLDEIHVLRVLANFAVGEAMHPAARMLPRSGGEEVAVPGVWHFERGAIIPVFSASSTGVMADFPYRDGVVASCAKVGGKRGVLDVLGSGKEGAVARWAVASGEEGVAGGSAGGGLNVVPGEGTTVPGQ